MATRKKKVGHTRQTHKPSPKQVKLCKKLAAANVSKGNIAKALGLDFDTVKRHYNDIIEQARLDFDVAVHSAFAEMATSGECWAATRFAMVVRRIYPDPTVEARLATEQGLASLIASKSATNEDASVVQVVLPADASLPVSEWIAKQLPARQAYLTAQGLTGEFDDEADNGLEPAKL